ncbi:hypothetical protein SAMN05428988_0117 [Chitinophaga sp. YR573]|uniref:hypothetical protein n=1 Tax=Chitinophaga sp. YR573 TaxID=1881040 RepID=UPI0008AADCE3|nr:hypothetical protein [Chitinophaga sp. YR573]SEV88536.1 hypothetical protein SAMN05428988_0117 [Chitinophaga sp. YR573]
MTQDITKQLSLPPTQFNYFDGEQFAVMQRLCNMFASSDLVPDRYRVSDKNPEKKAVANCMIAIETAMRIGASPLMVMQNMDIIQGKPSWSSKFLIGTINTCGRFSQLKYKIENLGKVGKVEYLETKWVGGQKQTSKLTFDGTNVDNLQCIAYANEKGSDTVLESSEVSIKLAIQEGWYQKVGSKWPTMTKKMLMYRAASFWTNEHAPELSLGMKTVEEANDIEDIDFEDVSDRVKKEVKQHGNKKVVNMDEEPLTQTTDNNAATDKGNGAEAEQVNNQTSEKEEPGF